MMSNCFKRTVLYGHVLMHTMVPTFTILGHALYKIKYILPHRKLFSIFEQILLLNFMCLITMSL